jgi:ribonuclease BN (tRNA processing enzyme)
MGFLKFLGTAGARFVVMHQLRASGGLWINLDTTNLLIDPGPGSLLHCLHSTPKLDPATLDGILLTHRHLDHTNDINIMIEAMTNGGYHKKGTVYAPTDAITTDPVILQHTRHYIHTLTPLQPHHKYTLNTLTLTTSEPLHHSVETYGITIQGHHQTLALITDTEYYPDLATQFTNTDLLIINVVLHQKKTGIGHLSIPDAEDIIYTAHPKLAILTHFGMTLVNAHPQKIAEDMTTRLGIPVIAATDGLQLPLTDTTHP